MAAEPPRRIGRPAAAMARTGVGRLAQVAKRALAVISQ